MIQIYKSKESVKKNGYKLIENIDIEFNSLITSSKINLDNLDLEMMRALDKAILVNNKVRVIKTPYGDAVDICNLSTGCKACILSNHLKDTGGTVISLEQCGRNAIKYALNIDNRKYLMRFCTIPADMKLRHKIIVNNKIYTDIINLMEAWEDNEK